MDIQILSLASSTERREKITENLRSLGCPFSFADGIDGRKQPIARASDSTLTNTEAACSLGHLKIYEAFLESGQDLVCILEDDVTLTADFKTVLEAAAVSYTSLTTPGSLLLLGGQEGLVQHRLYHVSKFIKALTGTQRLYRTYKTHEYIYRTCGYIVDRRAAEGLCAINKDLTYRADDWKAFYDQKAISNVFTLSPGIVVHPVDLKSSLIQTSREESYTFHANPLSRAAKIVARFLRLVCHKVGCWLAA